MPFEGGVERPRRVVRFARLIGRRVRVLGGPSVRAAFSGSLSTPRFARGIRTHSLLLAGVSG
jgi:hypothetical protein